MSLNENHVWKHCNNSFTNIIWREKTNIVYFVYVIGLSESKTITLDFVKTVTDIDNSFYTFKIQMLSSLVMLFNMSLGIVGL